MFTVKRIIFCAIALFIFSIILNANAANISQTEASTGLKSMLNQATKTAVKTLGTSGGFNNNPEVRIELPEKLESASKVLKMVGLGNQITQLENSMNAAAEAAVPEAQQILINSIQQMSFSDAKSILTGGDKATTAYLEKTNRTQLFNKLLPKVKTITNQSNLSTQYNTIVQRASALGITNDNLKIENYVTNKAIDGLFTVIGNQESYIRNNPKEAATSAAKKVFEALIK
ncbi:DUF4197 domain-containing protein [Gammaproteobacteria bacterium ESL0073]|uniref:DUF4197 domain-containing protein n=1 Tax=Entomomonas moraniae TaxID=2213226 RepID=A0A3Q9JL43_9GAMM|nr:DUF4197 domain-containing protein [Entomomonas moraniae]AWM81130.1 DUF4197 domain-containing protein [Gammaproteobacteria bacterium ESL0073]AZS52046.1 DUF4197 domain-containing protein [Entomomonas moraniae]